MPSYKILVIDDSGVIRRAIKDMLPADKFEVLEAKDGAEGLQLIRQEHPKLILLDFILPKLNGSEVFQQILIQRFLEKIALVIMSGSKKEVTQKIPEPFKHFGFIEKPFDQKSLMLTIKEAMDKVKFIPPPQRGTDKTTVDAKVATEIPQLNQQIVKMQAEIEKIPKMQAEIELLKKQVAQLVTVLKQKLK